MNRMSFFSSLRNSDFVESFDGFTDCVDIQLFQPLGFVGFDADVLTGVARVVAVIHVNRAR